MKAVAYYRVSTNKQGESGLGLAAQRADVLRWCKAHDHDLVAEELDIQSGKTVKNRPGLQIAIKRCNDGEAEVLVVAKLDRMARSTLDAVGIMERAVKRGWKLAAIDMGIDMTSPMGQFFATMMAAFAQWERSLISERTKKAMEQARLMGRPIGAPRSVPEDFRLALHTMSEAGMSDTEIARELNGQGMPHPRTGTPTWTRKDVWSLRRRASLLAAEAEAA